MGMLVISDVGDMGCWGSEMLGMWGVRDVGCLRCRALGMWDVLGYSGCWMLGC